MKGAVVTLTLGGIQKALEVKRYFPTIHIYTKSSLAPIDTTSKDINNKDVPNNNNEGIFNKDIIKGILNKDIRPIKMPLKDFVGQLMTSYDYLLFIMATGIVVRIIAPYLKDKKVDPAVLVMDEKGQFIISLLSGHLGGANDLANEMASVLKATPVITTASDVQNTMAVDTIAMKLHCHITDFEWAKRVTAMVVNNQQVCIHGEYPINFSPPKPYCLLKSRQEVLEAYEKGIIQGMIYIGKDKNITFPIPFVQLIPRQIVIGIGCRKGKDKESIKKAIYRTLEERNVSIHSLAKLSTVEVKKEEEGLIQTAKELGVPIDIITLKQIKKVEHKFEPSPFVAKTIGVGAVCEPCGYLSSNRGRKLMGKQKLEGITLSLWEISQPT